MKRKLTSVDHATLLDLRQLALRRQQAGEDVKPHELVDEAIKRFVRNENKKLAS